MALGQIAFLGSGETSLAGGRIFETLARALPQPLRIAILETPAGFELNSHQVAGRVADFFKTRLQNYTPRIDVIPARKRGTPFSPDEAAILRPLLYANLIFMGPGSPTYATRQLQGSLAWELIRARHRLGATLAFASAATVSIGAWSLPSENITIGLDEHTGLIIDFETEQCEVNGVSSVSLVRDCGPKMHPSGARFPISELGSLTIPDPLERGIRLDVWEMAVNAPPLKEDGPSEEVLALLELREQARLSKNWAESDRLREQIAALGWTVQDTKEGQKLARN